MRYCHTLPIMENKMEITCIFIQFSFNMDNFWKIDKYSATGKVLGNTAGRLIHIPQVFHASHYDRKIGRFSYCSRHAPNTLENRVIFQNIFYTAWLCLRRCNRFLHIFFHTRQSVEDMDIFCSFSSSWRYRYFLRVCLENRRYTAFHNFDVIIYQSTKM